MTAQDLIDFENKVRDLWEAGELPYLTHLTSGNEQWLVDYFRENVRPDDFVCCSHRHHFHALLHGFEPDYLLDRIKQGYSMFNYSENFLCSAIVAGVCSIACGIALGIQQKGGLNRVHCWVGDGATDEGSFWEAVRFAIGRNLPIQFIIEDNGAQCGVSARERWGNNWPFEHILNPSSPYPNIIKYYRYTSTFPHAGNLGPDGKPTRPPIKWPQIERKIEKPV